MRQVLKILIALVWLINGLFFKILDLIPRHQDIVAAILGIEYSLFLTKTIGILEVLMFVWIISSIKPKVCAVIQIFVVLVMNAIEFIMVPDMLLFGKLNLVFAIFFSGLIYVNAFSQKNA